jgi:hypothetical protein
VLVAQNRAGGTEARVGDTEIMLVGPNLVLVAQKTPLGGTKLHLGAQTLVLVTPKPILVALKLMLVVQNAC